MPNPTTPAHARFHVEALPTDHRRPLPAEVIARAAHADSAHGFRTTPNDPPGYYDEEPDLV